MKQFFILLCSLSLVSCAGIMTKHRMKAADRKVADIHDLQRTGRWEEARTLADGLKSSVAKSVEAQPVRSSASGQSVDLRPLLAAWENGPWSELAKSLEVRDAARATSALTALRQQCINCHLVLGRRDIVVTEIMSQ